MIGRVSSRGKQTVATKKKKAPRKDWRMILFLILSVIIVLSMALAFVIPSAY